MLSLSRKLLAACLLVAGMATAGLAQTFGESTPVTSQEGHFHAVFPGAPKVATNDGILATSYSPENSGMAYMVMYKELPADMVKALDDERISSEDRLAAFTKGCMNGINGKITAERSTQSSEVAGTEVCFETAGGASGVVRCFVSGGRLYQVIVIWSGVAPAASDVSNFLDSFGLDS